MSREFGFEELPDTYQRYIVEDQQFPASVHQLATEDPKVCCTFLRHMNDEWESYAERMKPRILAFFRGSAGARCPKHHLQNCEDAACSSIPGAAGWEAKGNPCLQRRLRAEGRVRASGTMGSSSRGRRSPVYENIHQQRLQRGSAQGRR